MRVRQSLATNDNNLASQLQHFADYLLKVGEGKIPTITLPTNIPSDYIPITNGMHLQSSNLLDLLKAVYYPDIRSNSSNNLEYFIVCQDPVTYFSYDCTIDSQDQMLVPVETLNSIIESGSIPPHKLLLKIGTPIIAIRNIDPKGGICNGTRLIVKSLGQRIIEAVIATGSNKGDIAYISKINFFTVTASDANSPYDFSRFQFPVRLAFSMTINKAQRQTLDLIGLYLPEHVFGHGRLYVALS